MNHRPTTSILCLTTNKHHLKNKKKCSYCRQENHTITSCDDPNIDLFYRDCISIRDIYISEIRLKSYISGFNTILIKALCLKLKLVNTLSEIKTKQIAIHILTLFIMQQQEEDDAIYEMDPPDQIVEEEVVSILTTQLTNIEFIKLKINKDKEEKKCPLECPVCYTNTTTKILKYNCSHFICSDCFIGTVNSLNPTKKLCCSLCRELITHVYSEQKFEIKITKLLVLNSSI